LQQTTGLFLRAPAPQRELQRPTAVLMPFGFYGFVYRPLFQSGAANTSL
jgi:hypothetical protein